MFSRDGRERGGVGFEECVGENEGEGVGVFNSQGAANSESSS